MEAIRDGGVPDHGARALPGVVARPDDPAEPAARWIGPLAILVTDQVDSTRLLDQFGDELAEEVRLAHYRLLRAAVADHGGCEIKSTGDGLMVAFAGVAAAAACAVRIQQLVAEHSEANPERALEVRIGIHTGRVVTHAGDLYGTAVVIANRLCEQAGAGGILLSCEAAQAIGPRQGFQLAGLRARRLKGFSQRVLVRALHWCPVSTRSTQGASPRSRSVRLPESCAA